MTSQRPKSLWANWYWVFKGPNESHARRHASYRTTFKETRRARNRRVERLFVRRMA